MGTSKSKLRMQAIQMGLEGDAIQEYVESGGNQPTFLDGQQSLPGVEPTPNSASSSPTSRRKAAIFPDAAEAIDAQAEQGGHIYTFNFGAFAVWAVAPSEFQAKLGFVNFLQQGGHLTVQKLSRDEQHKLVLKALKELQARNAARQTQPGSTAGSGGTGDGLAGQAASRQLDA